MTAGLPGTGIGGFFYLLSALLMPAHEFCLMCQGKSNWSRWKIAVKQSVLAFLVIASVWGTGWLLGTIMSILRVKPETISSSVQASNVIKVTGIYFSLLTLLGVIVAIQCMGMIPNKKCKK